MEPGSAPSPPPASPPPAETASPPAGGVETPDANKTVEGALREAFKTHSDGRARGPDGKFIKAEAAPTPAAPEPVKNTATTDTPKVTPEQPSTAALKPPTSWSPDAKAAFDSLPPAVQQAVLKRESEVSDGFKQKSEELKRWDGLDKAIAPHRSMLANLGYQNDGEAISRLLEIQAAFQRDPAAVIRQMAQAARIDPRTLAAQTPPAGPQPTAPPSPAAAPLTQAQIDAQINATFAKREAASTIQKFEADPAHPHASKPEVKRNMAIALHYGGAKDLEAAYMTAIRMDPVLFEEYQAQQAEAQKAAAAKKADEAKRAAVSIRGAPSGPGNGISPPKGGSVREELARALSSHSGRA